MTHDAITVHGRLLDPALPGAPLGWIRCEGGMITQVGEGLSSDREALGGPDRLICPGFVDAHVHLPQFPAIGCDGLDLLRWLDAVTYPTELAWADERAARSAAGASLAAMLRSGTLGFAGYLTSHEHAVNALVEANRAVNLRWTAGRVLMDRLCPEGLQCPADAALSLDRPEDPRSSVSINPRFAICCSDEQLFHAGRQAAAHPAALIQTHLAESVPEVAAVAELFPDAAHYTGVYDHFGLLSQRTLLGHCVHLSADEWLMIASRGCAVVHCPTANTFLSSGLFDMRRCIEHSVRLGLGSDVAGGCDVAMPRVARAMIDTAKLRRLTLDPLAVVPTPMDAWSMITRGNAALLGWDDHGLQIGGRADLLMLRWPREVDEHIHGRLIYGWDDSLIERRIVNGQIVDVEQVFAGGGLH